MAPLKISTRAVSFYNRETGLLNGQHLMASDAAAIALNTPDGHAPIDGFHDHLSRRVDLASGEIVDYQPSQPSADYEWNAESRRWVLDKAATARQDAARSAKARIQALETQERALLRRLALDPTDAAARASLAAIDTEIAELQEKANAQ